MMELQCITGLKINKLGLDKGKKTSLSNHEWGRGFAYQISDERNDFLRPSWWGKCFQTPPHPQNAGWVLAAG